MNLYNVTYGIYQYFAIAKTEEEAVEKVTKGNSLAHLSFKAEIIDLGEYSLVKKKS